MMRHALQMILAAAPEDTVHRFKTEPRLWVVFMVIVPAVVAYVWWMYRREGRTAPTKVRGVLAVIRILAILLIILILFGPYSVTSHKRLVKSDLVVLLDTSESMEFVDRYADEAKVEATRNVAGLTTERLTTQTRLKLLKKVLGNRKLGLLDDLAAKFQLQIYTFDSRKRLLAAPRRVEGDPEEAKSLEDRIADIQVTGSSTSIGDAVTSILRKPRIRSLAGIVIVTDGRQNTGATSAVEAAQKAAEARDGVPIFVLGVGDPDLPKNIKVANLRAREVVLRGEEVSLAFTITHKGFEGELVNVVVDRVDERGEVLEQLDLRGADVVIGPEEEETTARVFHRFSRPGYYQLRAGVPVQPDELIETDNFLTHHIRVIDRKIKVLFVDGYPRWEYRYLKEGLVRDKESLLVHVINQEAARDVVPPYSIAPGWTPRRDFPSRKEDLYEYDVVIFGDVNWRDLGKTEAASKEALANLRQFVADGGGFIMVAGPYNSPRSYRNTDVRHILPIVVGQENQLVDQDTTRSFNLKLTDRGEDSPIFMLEEDPRASKRIWEEDRFAAQFWYFPVERAKSSAVVLARHPATFGHNKNKFGAHVLAATMQYKSGKTLYVGVDELWRLRWSFGDRYHYRFYSEAIRYLATAKLLGGNRRFKIFTDREVYYEGDEVHVTAEVFDENFEPSRAGMQPVTVQLPDGREDELVLALSPHEPGSYEATLPVDQEGSYMLMGPEPTGDEERAKKRFKVEYSTEEMKNPLIDVETMKEMARLSGGRFLPLYQAGDLKGIIPPRSAYATSTVEPRDLWDNWWVLIAFTSLLAVEWLIRKRFRLL